MPLQGAQLASSVMQMNAQRERLVAGESAELKFICNELEQLKHFEESAKGLHKMLQDKDRQIQTLRSLHGDECERSTALTQQLRRVDATNVYLTKR